MHEAIQCCDLLCVAFSALVNAGQRKIAYDRGGKIFVADVDGTQSKKIADGSWPEISPDRKRLLLSIDMGEESGRKDWDGPLPALWSFDLQSQKATRLTPKKLFGWDGVWLDNDNVLFLSRAAGEKNDSIYRMSVDGKNLKRLIKNARFPSVSAP